MGLVKKKRNKSDEGKVSNKEIAPDGNGKGAVPNKVVMKRKKIAGARESEGMNSDFLEPPAAKRNKTNEDDDVVSPEKPQKPLVNFPIAEFRMQLKGTEAVKYLRDFANHAEWGTSLNDVVLDFLNAGGSIGEICALLDATAPGDLATALPVFRVVFLILVKIQADATSHLAKARQDAENLLASFVPTFQAMIAFNSSKHRKVVFKLMASLVSLRSSFGRQILNWFSLNPLQLECCVEHGPVRKSFIMFLLAFFNDGNVTNFRSLLEKKGLLSSIFPNLKYDPSDVVVLVLNVLREKMLMNSKLPKTTKLNVFNTHTIHNLFLLYDWVGPKNYAKVWKKPKRKVVDPEELASVALALDNFLLVLCTDRKHGVAFADNGLGVISQSNQLLFTALEMLPKPWSKPAISKIAVEILKNSPDLIKPCLSKWESSFEPRDSEAWTKAVSFYMQVLLGLDATSIVDQALGILNQAQLQSAMDGILFHREIMKRIKCAFNTSKPVSMQCQAVQFLSGIASVTKSFSSALFQRDLPAVKKHLLYSLKSVIPDIDFIMQLWDSCKGNSENQSAIAKFLLKLVEMECVPAKDSQRLCKMLVKDLKTLSDDSSLASDILEIICLLDSSFFTPNNDEFKKLLKLALSISLGHDCRITPLARIILNTGLFEPHSAQLDVLVSAWMVVASDELHDDFIDILVNTIVNASNAYEKNSSTLVTELIGRAKSSFKQWPKVVRRSFKTFFTYFLFHLAELSEIENLPLVCEKSKNYMIFDVNHYLQKIVPTEEIPLVWSTELKIRNDLLSGKIRKDMSIAEDGGKSLLKTLSVFQLSGVLTSTIYLTGRSAYNIKKMKHGERTLKEEADSLRGLLDFLGYFKTLLCEHTPNWKVTAVSLDQSLSTLRSKMFEAVLTERVFLDEFLVDTKNILLDIPSLTIWLETLLPKNGKFRSDVILPWKLKLLEWLKMPEGYDSNYCNLSFWLSVTQPSLEEFTEILRWHSKLLPKKIKRQAGIVQAESGVGSVWFALLRAVEARLLPSDLISTMVKVLSEACCSDFTKGNFDIAFQELLSKWTLSVICLPEDFLQKVSLVTSASDKLIEALFLCFTRHRKNELVEILVKSGDKINVKIAWALLQYLLTEQTGACKMNLKDPFQKLGQEVQKVFPTLVNRCSDEILTLINSGNPSDLLVSLPKITDSVKLVLLRIAKDPEGVDRIIDNCNSNHVPPLDLLPCLAVITYPKSPQLVTSWVELLCNSDKFTGNFRIKAITALVGEEELLKVFVDVRQREFWKGFVDETLSYLSESLRMSDAERSEIACRISIIRQITNVSWSEGAENSELAQLFAKCVTDSGFVPVMLSNSPVKAELVGLLHNLVRLWPPVASLNHVPLYLASYTASLSSTDQNILSMLRSYENLCGDFSKFEPLLWGQPAVSHYSVRSGGGVSLWRQVNMKSVMELIDVQKIMKTVTDFPVQRTLQGGDFPSDSSLYDPAFLLPLFSNLFSPSAVTYCLTFIHRGGLSLTIAALSSLDVNMRSAAAVVLSRFYSHLQLTQHSKQKPVWLHLIDCIRFGMESLSITPIPGVVTLFWAQAIMQIADPHSPLYTLHRFLLAKPAANLRIVPEFMSLFFSGDVKHATQRKWILEIIRDGVRSDGDVSLLMKGTLIPTLMTFFSTPSASTEFKTLVLQILEKILRMGSGAKKAMESLCLDLWLLAIEKDVKGALSKPFASLVHATIEYNKERKETLGKVARKSVTSLMDAISVKLHSSGKVDADRDWCKFKARKNVTN